MERQFIKPAHDTAVPDIEVGQATISGEIQAVLQDDALGVERVFVYRLGVRIRRDELQAMGQAAVELHEQRIVVRTCTAGYFRDVTKTRARVDGTGGRYGLERPDKSSGGQPKLVKVASDPQVRSFRAHVAYGQPHGRGELLLEVEVIRLDIGVVEVAVDGRWGKKARPSVRIRQRDSSTRRWVRRGGKRLTERRIGVQSRDNAGDRLVCKDSVSRPHHCFLILERGPHESNAGLEVPVIGVEGLIEAIAPHLHQELGGRVKNRESIGVLRRRRVPAIAKPQFQGEVRPHLEAVFGEPVVGGRKNAIGLRSYESKRGCCVSKEGAGAGKSKDRSVESEIVVINAADFAAKSKVMPSVEPA